MVYLQDCLSTSMKIMKSLHTTKLSIPWIKCIHFYCIIIITNAKIVINHCNHIQSTECYIVIGSNIVHNIFFLAIFLSLLQSMIHQKIL